MNVFSAHLKEILESIKSRPFVSLIAAIVAFGSAYVMKERLPWLTIDPLAVTLFLMAIVILLWCLVFAAAKIGNWWDSKIISIDSYVQKYLARRHLRKISSDESPIMMKFIEQNKLEIQLSIVFPPVRKLEEKGLIARGKGSINNVTSYSVSLDTFEYFKNRSILKSKKA